MSADQVPPQPTRGNLYIGILVGAGLTSLAYTIGGISSLTHATIENRTIAVSLSVISAAIIWGLGLLQWIYVLPLGIYFLRKRQTRTATGLLIAALLVLVLNIACWVALGDLEQHFRM